MVVAFSLLAVIGGIGIFKGLNPKRVSSWLFGLAGLVGGLILGISRADVPGGMLLGLLFGGLIMYGGAMVYLQRLRYERLADNWLSLHGQEVHVVLLARIIGKLRSKRS